MSDFTPTAEQRLIVEAARTTTANLRVEARAGAAKTTTLVMLAEALPTATICALAFNRKIKLELAERLPPNATALTLNGIGFKAARDYQRKIKLEKEKVWDLITIAIERVAASPEEAEVLNDRRSEYASAIRAAKAQGYLPEKTSPLAKPLISDDSFFAEFVEQDFEDGEIALVKWCVKESFLRAQRDGIYDFDDQLYMPVLLPMSFPKYDVVLVDEAQDLSPINHALIAKLVKRGRLIAVGDPCQAIYGFRGALEASMNTLAERFEMETYYLTTCFRCAKAVVEAARWRAPDMNWFDTAPPGEVRWMEGWSASDIMDGDAVICRNNAPLFSLAVKLIGAGRYPEVASGDLIKGLRAVMKKLGKPKMTRTEALASLDEWYEREQRRQRSKKALADRYECIRIFILARETLGDAIAFLASVAAQVGRIKLMTGHKAKGLEFDRVWFLDEQLIGREDQDPNVRYVIQTRAKQELIYVKSEDFR